jgi:hypothetical protein
MASDNFLTDMNTLFNSFFKFNGIQPSTTGIPQDKISGAKTLAGYLVSQNDKNETKNLSERASTAAAVVTNKDTSVTSFLILINELKLSYKSNSNFKALVDFYVKQENFNRIRMYFFSLVISQCKNIKSINDATTLQTYIDDYLIPDFNDKSTFTEQFKLMSDFMFSLLDCMNTVLNTNTPPVMNTSASGGPGALVATQDSQRKRQSILNLDPNFYSKLETFVYQYLALFLCHIIVTFTNSSENTHVTTIPPERWAFILPYIADETTNQDLTQQQRTLLQAFVKNNSLSEIISAAQYSDDPDIKKIQLINKTIDSVVSIIDAKIASINNETASTGISLMKTRVLNECNALRRSIEYNKVKGIYTANVDITNKIAALLIYFASYYPKEDYKVGRNEAYYPRYLGSVLNSIQNNNAPAPSNISSPNRGNYNYIANISWFCEHYQDGNFNDQIQLFFNKDAEEYRSQNSNGKTITTPTTLTIVTVDSRGNKKSTCAAVDMYPPDTKFNPIAVIMKQKAVAMNLQTDAKALYDQILADRRECKATVTTFYSKGLSSLTSKSWEKLGGRRTRRHIKQKNQKKQKKANKNTQKRRKFRTRKPRK